MKWMIFRQEGIQVPGRFPWLFSYPGELRDSPTRRSEPLLAKQPPREVQHENALPGIGLMPRAGDESLRERIPDGQQRRELPLERRFGADVVTYLDVDELRPPLRDEVDLFFGTASRRRSRSLASSTPGRPRSRTCGPSPCRASPGSAPSRFRNSNFFKVSKPRRQYAQGCIEG